MIFAGATAGMFIIALIIAIIKVMADSSKGFTILMAFLIIFCVVALIGCTLVLLNSIDTYYNGMGVISLWLS